MRRRKTVVWMMVVTAAAVFTPTGRTFGQSCHTSSDYDITLTAAALQFERKSAPYQIIEMQRGALSVNRKPLTLSAEDRRHVTAFESKVRQLVPKIKALGQRAVDLMAAAIHEEAARSSPGSASRPELKARVHARAQQLNTRIANSTTSKEWRPEAISGYVAGMLTDVLPLLTGDLTQKAVDLTMKGDFGGVIALKDQALTLRASLDQRIQARLETLQPEIDKLCPSLRELDRLETGMTQGLPDGTRLNLIKVDS